VQTASEYFEKGNVKSKLGDYQEALKDYNNALEINHKYADAYYYRGIAKIEIGDYKSAIVDFNNAIRINPNDAVCIRKRGGAKYKIGAFQVVLFYSEVPDETNKEANSLIKMGDKKLDAQDLNGALSDYTKAINLNPLKEFFAYHNRGVIKSILGDYQKSILDYNLAIYIDPHPSSNYCNRGYSKARLNDLRGAISDFDTAIEHDPYEGTSYYNRGLAKYLLGDKNSACIDLSKAGELGVIDAYDVIKQFCK